MLSGLETSDFSIWMGFRPSFPDSLPVIDEHRVAAAYFLRLATGIPE